MVSEHYNFILMKSTNYLSPFLNPYIEFMSNVLPLGGVGGYPKLLELAEEPNPEYF